MDNKYNINKKNQSKELKVINKYHRLGIPKNNNNNKFIILEKFYWNKEVGLS